MGELYASPPAPEVWEEIAPGIRFKDVLSRLQKCGTGPVVLVGHQPDMSHLIAFLIADAATEITLPPGAMAALTLPQGVGAGAGRLHWLVTPDLLRSLTPTNG
jgi:phosphohistidine phosphatase SixA